MSQIKDTKYVTCTKLCYVTNIGRNRNDRVNKGAVAYILSICSTNLPKVT